VYIQSSIHSPAVYGILTMRTAEALPTVIIVEVSYPGVGRVDHLASER